MFDKDRYGIFDTLNERFFNAELPSLPIVHVASATVNWHGLHVVRTNEYGETHCRIIINTMGLATASQYLGVIAHEMVHHWQEVKNIPGKDHGKRFKKKAKKIEKVLGIKVRQPVQYYKHGNRYGEPITEETGIVQEYLKSANPS